MQLTLLLDLDDTLLDTNLDSFGPAYFHALEGHMARRVAPEVMLTALISGTNLMNESEDPTHTLQEVFESSFIPAVGISKEEFDEFVDDFYDNVFPTLGSLTKQRAEAASLVEWALARGFRVAIATDP
ncbi:MAG TPA: hypothetical protein VJ785_07600, partial [Anaerolineales bacterium]|nr:hypothetical protein [Anaerolineales bacterium]